MSVLSLEGLGFRAAVKKGKLWAGRVPGKSRSLPSTIISDYFHL
jgi:hypothetical protein